MKWMDTLRQWFEAVYLVCFTVGVCSIRCLKSLRRFTRLMWVPVARLLRRVLDFLLLRHLRVIGKELGRVGRDFRTAMKHVRETASQNRGRAVLQILAMPILAVRRHRKVFRTVYTVSLLVIATLSLVLTVQYWSGATFALALEYQGEPIGYIAGEQVYAEAATMVRDAVINADESFTVEQAPKMRLEIFRDDMVLLSSREVSNRVLSIVGSELVNASGLYVDGTFRGALESRQELEALMQSTLDAKALKDYDGTEFSGEVEIVHGLYPKTALVTSLRMKAYLGTLTIAHTKTVTRTDPVPYKVIERETENIVLGHREEVVKGKAGSQEVTIREVYVNGAKQSEIILSTAVIKEPVDAVYEVGVKKYNEDAEIGDGVATGTFIWPLPYTKNITSQFASRWGGFHGAIDIAGSSTHGKPIIASDGGTVVEAQWHNSWGNYVLIDHGNGFKTRYAHCSKLEVKAGDKVAQGQYIAKVGNTGYSFGAHLHFEVIKNGVLVNPLDYVQR